MLPITCVEKKSLWIAWNCKWEKKDRSVLSEFDNFIKINWNTTYIHVHKDIKIKL